MRYFSTYRPLIIENPVILISVAFCHLFTYSVIQLERDRTKEKWRATKYSYKLIRQTLLRTAPIINALETEIHGARRTLELLLDPTRKAKSIMVMQDEEGVGVNGSRGEVEEEDERWRE